MGKKGGSENIRVAIRCRDLLKHELEKGHKQAVTMDLANKQVIIKHAIGDPDVFRFDAVFNNTFSQRDIFLQEVQPLVESVMTGYNATVFAYGQSGSGKTYTMTGDLSKKEGLGMMPQVVDHLFTEIKSQTSATKQFKVKVSYVELYLGKSRDLLADKQVNLEIKQNMSKNFYVKGASVEEVLGYDDAIRLFNEGTVRRQVASTDLNDSSSRSHSLFMLTVDQYDFEQDPSTPVIMSSKLNVVDLAGSEKLGKTNATGDTAKEGCQINLSLSSLAAVIDKIVKGEKHIPYRGSSLTMLLKDSLGGNSRTVMFANLGPSDSNISESISTLRFAERAKQIKNKPVKNMDPKDAHIAELMEKIAELQSRLGNADLNVEEQLKVRIEELEVENAGLQGASQNDNVHLEEEMKIKMKECEDLTTALKESQKLLEEAAQNREIADTHFKADLAAADELRSITTNFIKRVCNEQQVQLIHSKIPQEVTSQTSESDQQNGIFSVRELQFYLEGFVDLYEDWRSNVFTPEDLAKRVEQAKIDAQAQAAEEVAAVQRQMQQLGAQRESEMQNRSADTEAQSQMKVEASHLKEENQKLKEKIERDQEKFKKKQEKLRDEKQTLVEDVEAAKTETGKKAEEVAKLKALLEESASRGGGGGSVSIVNGQVTAGSPMKGGGDDRNALMAQLEEAQLKAAKFETRVKETNLMLRRKGICIQPGSAIANAGGIPNSGGGEQPPGAPMEQHLAPDGEVSAMDQATEDLFISEMESAPLDGDLITQLQQQIRVQHRLHELRHTQQRKLDDLIRKYEMVKTGTVTAVPDSSSANGTISEEALRVKIEAALGEKNAEIEELKASQEKMNEKLVKKVNKKMAEAQEREAVLAEEKQSLQEERDEIAIQCDQLTAFNTKVAIELESLRAQLNDRTSDQANEVRGKESEIEHLKQKVEQLKLTIEENKIKLADYGNLQADLSRMQQQHARTEASLKEKITSLDNNRQMIKWSNSLLETEKEKVSTLEEEARGRERSFHEMEENWRAQLIENANKLVQINNKRLEEQAAQYQDLIGEEQEKQKAIRVKLKKAKEHTQKAAQRYDEMVLENESLQTQYEELKISAMKMYRQRNESDGYGGGGGRKGF